jgi:hypothetical protein
MLLAKGWSLKTGKRHDVVANEHLTLCFDGSVLAPADRVMSRFDLFVPVSNAICRLGYPTLW